MRTIYKYPLRITNKQDIVMPEEAKILHVGIAPLGNPCLWAEVDISKPKEEVGITIYGTGHPIADDYLGKHIGTFNQGEFVWHVYRD